MQAPWVAAAGVSVAGAATGLYAWRNLTYDRHTIRTIADAGVRAKSVVTPDGAMISYGEGSGGGTPLLLIHGQGVSWMDYAPVLRHLTERFHVFAVDCFGHGGSTANPALYPAARQVEALTWFVDEVIGAPALVSGHSSGGLLTALLAARSPQHVLGTLIEDAPFFATEPNRAPATFAWRDMFEPMNRFLTLRVEDPTLHWGRFWLEHSYLRAFFGDNGWHRLVVGPAGKQVDRHPTTPPRLWWMPPSINRALDLTACIQDGSGTYDLRFGQMFFDNSWFADYDQADVLSAITSPTTLLHTRIRFSDDNVLLGAMDNDDAALAHRLVAGSRLVDDIRSGHDIHVEHPAVFCDAIDELATRLG